MKFTLNRFAYMHNATLGVLHLARPDSGIFYTIERPWIPHEEPGGKRFHSCIPDGTYEIFPYMRGDRSYTYSLANPDLGVYISQGFTGRYAVLMHPGNRVQDVQGCIAIGLSLHFDVQGPYVTSSRAAFEQINAVAPVRAEHRIEIVNKTGAVDA